MPLLFGCTPDQHIGWKGLYQCVQWQVGILGQSMRVANAMRQRTHNISLVCTTINCMPALVQVSYCQGMAFVAGVVLMYLPEEPAFQVSAAPMMPCSHAHQGGMTIAPPCADRQRVHLKQQLQQHHAHICLQQGADRPNGCMLPTFTSCCYCWQVLTRLMGPGGPDLRTLFLPGLEGLKQLLRTFEWLMTRLMPRTAAHLEARPTLRT